MFALSYWLQLEFAEKAMHYIFVINSNGTFDKDLPSLVMLNDEAWIKYLLDLISIFEFTVKSLRF